MAPRQVTVLTAAASTPTGYANALDLIALTDIKLELGLSGTLDDAWFTAAIRRCSTTIQGFCNRIFAVQNYQDQIFPYVDPYPWQSPTRTDPLQLGKWPIAASPSPALTAPPLAPVLSAASGGSASASVIFARISYVSPTGETAASMEASTLVPASSVLQVTSPIPDPRGIATGWNLYAGPAGAETLQNAEPLAIGTPWTCPGSGLIAGAALPTYVLAVENFDSAPQPLAEQVDFLADARAGQLTRLFNNGQRSTWSMAPILIAYRAGFSPIPADVQDAAIQLVKGRYFGRTRDPSVRSQNVVGVLETAYWFGSGPGAESDLPPPIADLLERAYRVPVIA